jgi:methyl-accepting chemotaxis protein
MMSIKLSNLSTWPFKLKLGLGPLIGLVMMAIIAVVGILGVGAQSRSLDVVVHNAVDGSGLLVKASSEIRSVNGGIYRVLALQAAKTAKLDAAGELKALGGDVDLAAADLKKYRDGWATASDKPKLDQLIKDVSQYKGAIDWVTQMLEIDFNSAVSFLAPLEKNYGVLNSEISSMIAAGQRMSAAQEADAHDVARSTLIIFVLVTLAAAVVVLGLGFFIGLGTTKSIQEIAKATHDLASGDVQTDLSKLARTDELGQLVKSLTVFRDNQLNIIALRKEQTLVVSTLALALEALASGDLTYRVTDHIAGEYGALRNNFNQALEKLEDMLCAIWHLASTIQTGSGEISSATDDLSRRTEHQAATLEQTAAALDAITITVKSSAEGATQAQKAVSAANQDAIRSGKVVGDAVAAMHDIKTSAGQIGDIVGGIDEIAFQTNLLALNAGIEAARAGDAGRGFAVVASEVRALANRSAEMAKQIKELVNTSNTQVNTGEGLVGEAGKALERIVTQVTSINQVINQIAAGAQEQANGIGQVNTAVADMDNATQKNAAMVEETTAASHSLAHEANELGSLLSRFKVTGIDRKAIAGEPQPAGWTAPERQSGMKKTASR